MELTLEQVATALNTALGQVLDREDFDVTLGMTDTARELDVSTDDWTLHLEGWPEAVAWLAIDDEPEDATQYDAARRAVMPETVEQAIAGADRSVDGAFSRALTASGDPFTAAFVAAISTSSS